MTPNLFDSKVIEHQELNSKFHRLKFKLEKDFSFEVGQFIVMKVAEGVFRDYSIASLPQDLPNWEIFVDITPQGPGTTHISQLKVGDIIQTTSPRGVFALNDQGEECVILAATGCGIASIKPMVEKLLSEDNKREIYVLWGLRFAENICFLDFFEDLQKKYSNFQYDIVLSKPEVGWLGKSGHVTHHVQEAARACLSKKTSVYLCGSGEMVADVKTALAEINFPYDKIYFEKYF